LAPLVPRDHTSRRIFARDLLRIMAMGGRDAMATSSDLP
jgi:hypothetical protein